MNEKTYLSVAEFAKHVDIHRNTVIRAIKEGRIQAFKVGTGKNSAYRIPYTECERLIKKIPIEGE